MADKITFDLEGFAEFEEQIQALAEGYRSDLIARNTLVKACKTAMIPVFNSAISRAPYDLNREQPSTFDGILEEKPHLRDTLRIDARIPNEKDKMSEYVNESDSAIAVVSAKKSAVSLSQEFGNARTSPQPFLRVSLESNIKNVLDALKYELSFLIPEYARKLKKNRVKNG